MATTTRRPTEPLREEHRGLLPHIETLLTAADGVDALPAETVRRAVDEAYEFLAAHLIPHAEAEDRALYPVVERVMGAPGVTATMSRDHVEVERLTAELARARERLAAQAPDAGQASSLRRVLYGLYALVKVHFAKEEELYLPLLDERLSPEEARAMFEAMERAAGEAKARRRG